jgi:hypothetical protein
MASLHQQWRAALAPWDERNDSMLWNLQQAKQLRTRQRRAFVVGWCCATALVFAATESYLAVFPPQDLHPYLGDQSPLRGIYVADPDLGVGFRSFDDLVADNPKTLQPRRSSIQTPSSERALFGSSFVHMQGALAEELRTHCPQQPIFILDRKETLTVRMAQARTLLEAGYRPERIVFVLMPIDCEEIGRQPIATHHVSQHGALTYTPSLPPAPLDRLTSQSRLALVAWARTGRHQGDPKFSRSKLYRTVPGHLQEDLKRSFSVLASLARRNNVSLAVVLIPAHRQVADGSRFGFQDAVGPVLTQAGVEVVDPREAFLAARDAEELYLDDGHLAPAGNRIVREELMKRWSEGGAR